MEISLNKNKKLAMRKNHRKKEIFRVTIRMKKAQSKEKKMEIKEFEDEKLLDLQKSCISHTLCTKCQVKHTKTKLFLPT